MTAQGKVYPFGDAPFEGDMSGTVLNGSVIAATGSRLSTTLAQRSSGSGEVQAEFKVYREHVQVVSPS